MASKQWFIPQINDFVSLGTTKKAKQGYIRYVGPLIGSKYSGIYYGIQLDQSDGKNNGTLDGNKYFECRKNHGLFTKRSKIKKVVIKHKSSEYNMQLVISHFASKSTHRLPFDIYQIILFYIPPQKLYFTKDQRGLNWFKIQKNRLQISTPTRTADAIKIRNRSKKKPEEPKIALLRFKDNCVSQNDLSTIHQTFPLRQWKHSNFTTFKLSLYLKCVGHYSSWVVPYDSDDGSEHTNWPVFIVLDAFKSNKYKYKEKKIWLSQRVAKDPDGKSDKQHVSLFGERMDGGNKWRYWVQTQIQRRDNIISDKIEPHNPIEIGFQFPHYEDRWNYRNSNVKILKQEWTFY
eukprot:63781_1